MTFDFGAGAAALGVILLVLFAFWAPRRWKDRRHPLGRWIVRKESDDCLFGSWVCYRVGWKLLTATSHRTQAEAFHNAQWQADAARTPKCPTPQKAKLTFGAMVRAEATYQVIGQRCRCQSWHLVSRLPYS